MLLPSSWWSYTISDGRRNNASGWSASLKQSRGSSKLLRFSLNWCWYDRNFLESFWIDICYPLYILVFFTVICFRHGGRWSTCVQICADSIFDSFVKLVERNRCWIHAEQTLTTTCELTTGSPLACARHSTNEDLFHRVPSHLSASET